jgi:O-antigen/teichoic acid export membrane protein
MSMGDLKKLLSHGAIYAVGAILARIVSLIMMPFYTRALSPTEYGIVDLLDTTAAVIVNVSNVSITYSVMRFYYDRDQPEERRRVISTAVAGLTLFGFISVALVWPLAPALSHAMFRTPAFALALRLMAINAILYGLVEVPMTYIRAIERPGLYIAVSLGRLLFGLALNIALVVWLHWGVMGVVYANAVSSAVTVLALLAFTLPKTGVHVVGRDLGNMLRFGIPLVPGALAMLVVHNGDRYILNEYRSLAEIGIYSLGYKLGMILTYALSVPFGNVWSTRMYTVMEEPGGRETYAKVCNYFVLAMLFGWVGLSVAAPEIVGLAASRQFAAATAFVPIIAGAYVFREVAECWKNAFMIRKRTGTIAWLQFLSAVLNIGITWVLVRSAGAMGAAWATALTFFVLLALTAVLAERILPTGVSLLRIGAAIVVALGLFALSRIDVHAPLAISLPWKFGLALAFPVALVACRVIPGEDRAAALRALAKARARFARAPRSMGTTPRSSLNP